MRRFENGKNGIIIGTPNCNFFINSHFSSKLVKIRLQMQSNIKLVYFKFVPSDGKRLNLRKHADPFLYDSFVSSL